MTPHPALLDVLTVSLLAALAVSLQALPARAAEPTPPPLPAKDAAAKVAPADGLADQGLPSDGFADQGVPSDGFAELGAGMHNRPTTWLEVHGQMRARGTLLHNLDLDRGLTPSGQALYPVPVADPRGQRLQRADSRLRTDLSLSAPGGQVIGHVRVDWLDGALGSAPAGPPAAATGQEASSFATIRRAWAEALLPFGVLAVGRMGSHWGLGLTGHGGDCDDCDSGDAADRIALVSPLFGHLLAFAYDFAAVGSQAATPAGGSVDADPADDVRTVTVAVLRYHGRTALQRRLRAGKGSFDYGAFVSHRWQDLDFPATWIADQPAQAGQAVARGLSATAGDVWLRWWAPRVKVEAEGTVVSARIDQPTIVPGALYRTPVESLQAAFAVRSRFGRERGWAAGLDLGACSGDPAPGFSTAPSLDQRPARPGDLFGAQIDPPRDVRGDDFRAHPDFRIDRVLFREIIGTVTDAAWLRPHIAWRDADFGAGALTMALSATASAAVRTASTPGGQRPLGVEVEPSLSYRSQDGFGLDLAWALLVPLSGLDNPAAGLEARPAQLLQASLLFKF